MLLREDEQGVLAIGQASHAWISGQLARAWGNDRFPAPAPREEVCLAAEQHDVGMASSDLHPTRNPGTGLPNSFLELPIQTHLKLWSAAPLQLLTQSRYAALLVSMHGYRLYASRDLAALPAADAAAVRDYLNEQRVLQERLLASLGPTYAPAEAVARNSQLLWTWDYMSLRVCLSWWPGAIEGVPSVAGEASLELAPGGDRQLTVRPWPFASDAITVHCDGRRLRGRFDTDAAMSDALARAPWETLAFELRRAQPA